MIKVKNKRVRLSYKKKSFSLDLKTCNWFEKILGLMFTRKKNAKALLFEFERPTKMKIHSFFVFFPFIAIWLDSDDKIISLKLVKQFKPGVSPKKPFTRLIEIPLNKKYISITQILVEDRKI